MQRYSDLKKARAYLEAHVDTLERERRGEYVAVPDQRDVILALVKATLALLDHVGIPKPIVNEQREGGDGTR